MTAVNEETTQRHVERILFKKQGNPAEPATVFFVGIHGNEPAGLEAFKEIKEGLEGSHFNGSLYVISGNRKALAQKVRFVDKDLNRIWSDGQLSRLGTYHQDVAEHKEQRELYNELKKITTYHTGPLYFIDFHTTSSDTLPFITINDALINRKFSKQFPVPIILGIEEYLNGPLLSYINQLGFVSLGFESGQHDATEAVINAKAFMLITLELTRVVRWNSAEKSEQYFQQLQQKKAYSASFYEVIERHEIAKEDEFTMQPGYRSFQAVEKGALLAHHNGKPIISSKKSMLFMPLYQAQGEEGFFLIRKIPRWALWLSEKLRKRKMDGLLTVLPGVSWADESQHALMIDLKTARFMAKPIFHLLGFRHRQTDTTHMKLYNRERVAKNEIYKQEAWF